MPSSVNPICGRPGCKYKVPHEHVKFIGNPDLAAIRALPAVAGVDVSSGNNLTDKIAAGLLKMGASSDPEADRFKDKSPEEVQLIVLGERMAKYADQTDKALAAMSDVSRKTQDTIEECWEHWKKDQQRPAWANDFAEWFESLMPRKDEIHRIGGDSCTARDNTAFLIGRADQLLRRRQLSVWGVVLGTIIGIYASLAGALLVVVVAAHTQQFWDWILGGSGL